MKRLKPAAEPIPRKFQPDAAGAWPRVKPTAEAIALGWTKPGVVKDCGIHCVAVQMDGEAQYGWYSVDYFEAE